MNLSKAQVKTKQRAKDHGEVFTAEREVNAMLDLVKHESERIDARFLEPACGTGNFLVTILERKLNTVQRLSKKNQAIYERNTILAVASIYGIELLEDNVDECRKRLYSIIEKDYKQKFGFKADKDCLKSISYLLTTNILHGDALSLKQSNGEPIIFPQWAFINNVLIQRHDYIYEYLMPTENQNQDLLSNGVQGSYHLSETGEPKFFPKSVKQYSPMHFLKIWEHSNGN